MLKYIHVFIGVWIHLYKIWTVLCMLQYQEDNSELSAEDGYCHPEVD